MGLAERRAVEQFKHDDYPRWKAKIDQVTGFEVPVEVAWEDLAVDDYSGSYADFFPKVYFQPLVDALTAITVDEIGKSAARDGLKKIVILNTDQYSSTTGFTFRDGVLTIDHRPHANTGDGEERAKGLQKLLESGL